MASWWSAGATATTSGCCKSWVLFPAHRPSKEQKAMSTEQNKELARRMYAALDQHEIGAIESIFAVDWVNVDPALPPLRGHAGARQLIDMFADAFPDFSTTIESLVAEGDLVAVRCTHS